MELAAMNIFVGDAFLQRLHVAVSDSIHQEDQSPGERGRARCGKRLGHQYKKQAGPARVASGPPHSWLSVAIP